MSQMEESPGPQQCMRNLAGAGKRGGQARRSKQSSWQSAKEAMREGEMEGRSQRKEESPIIAWGNAEEREHPLPTALVSIRKHARKIPAASHYAIKLKRPTPETCVVGNVSWEHAQRHEQAEG
jgi:hypothetical protein